MQAPSGFRLAGPGDLRRGDAGRFSGAVSVACRRRPAGPGPPRAIEELTLSKIIQCFQLNTIQSSIIQRKSDIALPKAPHVVGLQLESNFESNVDSNSAELKSLVQ